MSLCVSHGGCHGPMKRDLRAQAQARRRSRNLDDHALTLAWCFEMQEGSGTQIDDVAQGETKGIVLSARSLSKLDHLRAHAQRHLATLDEARRCAKLSGGRL